MKMQTAYCVWSLARFPVIFRQSIIFSSNNTWIQLSRNADSAFSCIFHFHENECLDDKAMANLMELLTAWKIFFQFQEFSVNVHSWKKIFISGKNIARILMFQRATIMRYASTVEWEWTSVAHRTLHASSTILHMYVFKIVVALHLRFAIQHCHQFLSTTLSGLALHTCLQRPFLPSSCCLIFEISKLFYSNARIMKCHTQLEEPYCSKEVEHSQNKIGVKKFNISKGVGLFRARYFRYSFVLLGNFANSIS